MFGLGGTELFVILAIVVLVFGANRLPKLGEGLGKSLRSFKNAVSDEPSPAPSPTDSRASGDV